MPYISLLNTLLAVWRPSVASDGAGGDKVTYTNTSTVRGRIDSGVLNMFQKEQGVVQDATTMIFVGPGTRIQNKDVVREVGGDRRCYLIIAAEQVDGMATVHHTELKGKYLDQAPAGVT